MAEAETPTRRGLSGPARQRLRLLGVSAGLTAISLPLWLTGLLTAAPLVHDPALAWWLLPIFCIAGAYLQIEVHDYRIASTVSLQDVPLLMALFLFAPAVTLPGYLVGGLVSRSIRRRGIAVTKEIFNAAQEIVTVGAVFAAFRAFHPDPDVIFSPRNIAAAAVASLVVWAVEEFCFTIGYSAVLGKFEMALSGTVAGMVTVTMNLSTALASLVFVAYQPIMALTILPPVILLVGAQRQADEHRQRALRMEFLYKTNELLHDGSDTVSNTLGLLAEIVPMFQVRRAELIITPPSGGVVRLVAEQGAEPTRDTRELDAIESALIVALASAESALRTGAPGGEALDAILPERTSSMAMGAAVSGLGSEGVLLLFDSTAAQRRFRGEDVTLLATLAAQVRSALERGDLSSALASAAEEKVELTHKALHDPLTRLANRSLFNNRVAAISATAGPDSPPSAVLFIDLDDFKLVNDTYGHAAGDEVLLAVAERLRSIVRATDVASRFGGDEFGLLIENLQSVSTAAATAQRVVASLGEPVAISEGEVRVRASVGVAIVGGGLPGCDAAELLRRADAAMYVSKRSGKGQFTVYDHGAEALFSQAEKEGVALRAALERDQFKMAYQPIIDTTTGALTAVRAGLRWQHPTRGLLAPDGFMAVAERAGLVAAIGLHVIERACAEVGRQRERGVAENVRICVPVFAKHLMQAHFVEETLALSKSAGIAPSNLVLTLDQAVAVDRVDEIGPRLVQITEAGFGLCIQAFGRRGDIPWGLLRTFSITYVELAADLTHALRSGSGADTEIVASVTRVATLLGVQAVATNVDDAELLDVLRRLGCTLAEGPAAASAATARTAAPAPAPPA